MFRDQKEELQRLQEALLQEEEDADREWEEEDWEEEEEDPEEWEEDWQEQEPANYRAYNSDRLDTDLEDFSREVYESKKSTVGRWLAAGLLLILAAILLALAFFAERILG